MKQPNSESRMPLTFLTKDIYNDVSNINGHTIVLQGTSRKWEQRLEAILWLVQIQTLGVQWERQCASPLLSILAGSGAHFWFFQGKRNEQGPCVLSPATLCARPQHSKHRSFVELWGKKLETQKQEPRNHFASQHSSKEPAPTDRDQSSYHEVWAHIWDIKQKTSRTQGRASLACCMKHWRFKIEPRIGTVGLVDLCFSEVNT